MDWTVFYITPLCSRTFWNTFDVLYNFTRTQNQVLTFQVETQKHKCEPLDTEHVHFSLPLFTFTSTHTNHMTLHTTIKTCNKSLHDHTFENKTSHHNTIQSQHFKTHVKLNHLCQKLSSEDVVWWLRDVQLQETTSTITNITTQWRK